MEVASSIWTAGSADSNRIGRERTDNLPHPVCTPPDAFINLIAIGWKHGYFVTSDNKFYSWGDGSSWRLATGVHESRPSPQQVTTFPEDYVFAHIVAGDKYGASASEDGVLMVWGAGYAHVPTVKKLNAPVSHIAAGQIPIICALTNGQCVVIKRKDEPKYFTIPKESVKMVAAGTSQFIALTETGKVYTWGSSNGTGRTTPTETPTLIQDVFTNSVHLVFAYHNNSWFVDNTNKLYCVGSNSDGSLGLGDSDARAVIRQHPHQFVNEIIQIGCGDDFTLVLLDNGEAYAAGSGNDGRNATGSDQRSYSFTKCALMEGHNITQVSCGCFSSAFLVDGALPVNGGSQKIESFDKFPLPLNDRSVIGPDKNRIILSPGKELLNSYGLQPGDIIQFHNEKAMVIGVNNENVCVCREESCSIAMIDMPDCDARTIVTKYPLLSRHGVQLTEAMSSNKSIIRVDPRDEAMIIFGGFKAGDILSDGSAIAGARGNLLFSIKNKIISEVDTEKVSIERRGETPIKVCEFVGNEKMIVELLEKSHVSLHLKYGLCTLAGKVVDKYAYSFAHDNGQHRLIKHKLDVVRKPTGKSNFQSFTPDMVLIDLFNSVEDTLKYGVAQFDVVKTPKGYGTVAGINNKKIAVWLEKNNLNFGSICLFSPSDIDILARYDAPFVKNGLSLNTSDFSKFQYLPSDEITIDEKVYMIAGTKDTKLYVYEGSGVKVLDKIPEKSLFKRHLFVEGTNDDGVSLSEFKFSLSTASCFPSGTVGIRVDDNKLIMLDTYEDVSMDQYQL